MRRIPTTVQQPKMDGNQHAAEALRRDCTRKTTTPASPIAPNTIENSVPPDLPTPHLSLRKLVQVDGRSAKWLPSTTITPAIHK